MSYEFYSHLIAIGIACTGMFSNSHNPKSLIYNSFIKQLCVSDKLSTKPVHCILKPVNPKEFLRNIKRMKSLFSHLKIVRSCKYT